MDKLLNNGYSINLNFRKNGEDKECEAIIYDKADSLGAEEQLARGIGKNSFQAMNQCEQQLRDKGLI